MSILIKLFNILIFPGFLFCFAFALLMAGIDRKLVAKMQRRIGPPVIQPFYDFFKLMGKEIIIPKAAAKKVFLAAPVIGLISVVTISVFIPMYDFNVFSAAGNGDIIVIIYLLTLTSVALIIGGSSSGSPYAAIGISREVVAMISYELPLIIILLTLGKKAGMAVNNGMTTFSMKDIMNYQVQYGPMITKWSMIPAMIAMLMVIPCEVGSLPFDVAEAEVEICEGPLVEYSGAPLGIFKLNKSIKVLIMSSLFVALFLGGHVTGITVVNVIIHLLLCIAVMILSVTLLKAATGRVRVEQMFKFYWTYPTALALISLILVYAGF